jgi:hypothetical protein
MACVRWGTTSREPRMTTSLPYGPESAAVRRFLAQLAGLSAADRSRVVALHATHAASRNWIAAEDAMAEAFVRSDRESLRDALGGPLMQLVRLPDAAATIREDEALASLDPIAESALAALLALVVRDLLAPAHVATLLAPFASVIDIAAL